MSISHATSSSQPRLNQNSSHLPNQPNPNPSFILKITIAIIGMFAFLQVYSVQSILPVMMIDFVATEVQAGMVVGATVMAISLMSPFLGMLSDAIGRKKIIVSALLFLTIPTALIGSSDSIEMMALWRFLQGLSVPGITVVTLAYVAEEFEGSAVVEVMSYYVSGTVFGGFMGRFILGHLHELIGWRSAYYVMAFITLIGAAWVAKVLPRSQHFVASPKFRTALGVLAGHIRNRYVVCAALLGFCVLFSLVGCFTFINLHLASAPYSLGTGQLANIFAIYLIGVIITPLSTRMVHRYGSAHSIIAAVILSMLGVVLTLFSPLWVIVLGLTLMSSGVFITQSVTISYIATNVHTGRSLASGLYYMWYYAGGTCGAWLCGMAYAYGEWSLTVGVLLFVQVFALIIVHFGITDTYLSSKIKVND